MQKGLNTQQEDIHLGPVKGLVIVGGKTANPCFLECSNPMLYRTQGRKLYYIVLLRYM